MSKQLREWTAPDGREKVLAEFMPCGGEICKGCEERCQNVDGRTPQAEWMADEIVRLRETIRHLACPICGTVNPPEVHTCTPRPKVTTVQRWDVIDERLHSIYGKFNSREDAQFYADGTDFRVVQMAYVDVTAATIHDAPHTVKRVALIDTDTGEGEG